MENEEYKVKQIWPAHASHISHFNEKFINELFKDDVVVQRKYDGERMLVHFNGNEVYCTSRRISKKTGHYTENQDCLINLPTLAGIGYTVLDCEFYSDTWADAVGVLHSLPERAHMLLETTSVKFAVFDCIFYNGQDLRDLPYSERLKYVFKVLSYINDDMHDYRFHFVEQFRVYNVEEAYKIAKDYWDAGKEGVVLKPLNKTYYDSGMMIKIKRTETLDCVVCGYQEGRGKYEGVVGALYIGYYDKESNNVVKISKVNCGTDEDRRWWKAQFDAGTAYGRVIEVKCQEVTDSSLRHPVYLRLREDKAKEDCTKDTIFKS